MIARLVAAAVLSTLVGAAHAQDSSFQSTPGMPCLDGSDPRVTGIPCMPIIHRNAIDEGRASSVLPKTRGIEVQNDPLGRSIGNSRTGSGLDTGFGNPAIQLPKIR